jgi:hypothetical protein
VNQPHQQSPQWTARYPQQYVPQQREPYAPPPAWPPPPVPASPVRRIHAVAIWAVIGALGVLIGLSGLPWTWAG